VFVFTELVYRFAEADPKHEVFLASCMY
jgi:hypothetical protein